MGIQPFHCRSIAFRLGFSGDQAKQMMKIAEATYNAFIGTDASQIEINPLVATTEGNLLALDAKINFDDNGLFRHPDIAMLRDEDEEDPLETRASRADLNYVRMDGNIGSMSLSCASAYGVTTYINTKNTGGNRTMNFLLDEA